MSTCKITVDVGSVKNVFEIFSITWKEKNGTVLEPADSNIRFIDPTRRETTLLKFEIPTNLSELVFTCLFSNKDDPFDEETSLICRDLEVKITPGMKPFFNVEGGEEGISVTCLSEEPQS